MTNPRIISERVVSTRSLGKNLPVVGNVKRKFDRLRGSIVGVCMAPVLIFIALATLFYGEKFKKSSKVIESLPLEQASEVVENKGMHKITGKPDITNPVEAFGVGNVLYYSFKEQRYEEVTKTETSTITRVINGEEVEETIEKTIVEDEWVTKKSESKWAEFKLGNIKIKPDLATLKVNLSLKEYKRNTWGEFEEVTGGYTPSIGDLRIVVEYLPTDENLIVIGEISGDSISSGEVFIISNKGERALLDEIKSQETTLYWVLKFLSWLLLTFGMLSILGPILSLLDFIPVAGKAANCLAGVISAILSFVIVLVSTLILKFWWLFIVFSLIFIVLLIVVLGVLLSKKEGSKEGGDKLSS